MKKRPTAIRLAIAGLLLIPMAAHPADIEVKVVDARGTPVSDAVICAYPSSGNNTPAPSSAEIVQEHQEFIPALTVVPVGSRIEFPNRDEVKHHVYSFSPAKKFDIPLYSGKTSGDVVFDKPGVVTVGCNIHDWMVARIFVTDTRFWALTGKSGTAKLTGLPAGSAEVMAWQARMTGSTEKTKQTVTPGSGVVTFTLDLKPDFSKKKTPLPPGRESY